MAAPAAVRLSSSGFCTSCLAPALRFSITPLVVPSLQSKRSLHHVSPPSRQSPRAQKVPFHSHSRAMKDYFSANTSIDRGWFNNVLLATVRTVTDHSQSRSQRDSTSKTQNQNRHRVQTQQEPDLPTSHSPAWVGQSKFEQPEASLENPQDLPHRRRQRKRIVADNQTPAQAETEADRPAQPPQESLPLDASSQLTTAATTLPTSATFRRRAATYLSLTKPRLSFLILLTTTSAYSLYPIPDILSTTASAVETSLSTSTLTLLFLTTGTFLSCACANTFNMLFEPKYDALMTRTRNRPLVRKLISPRAAVVFALLCGTSGLLLLGLGTNPTVAGLSALNIFLYAGVYTPMKRLSPANTWVGAIVGGIPPLMGWCAAAGQAATSEHHSWQDLLLSEDALGGWGLAALLFAWQFPHFMSLSHLIRDDYRNAGHQMLAWTNPARNARVALRYSIAMFPICGFLYWSGYVNPGFLAISTACNVWMTREAIRFWKKQGAGGSARGLFWASVWQLPLVLVGALVCKKGIWDGFFGSNDPISIYEDDQADEDGDGLGMESLNMENKHKAPGDLNMAMIGFKRPT